MEYSHLHFLYPLLLWTGLAIPLIFVVYFFSRRIYSPFLHIEKFIDAHLLPYVLINRSKQMHSFWIPMAVWSVAWLLLTLALAGPRWTYREIETYSKDQSLVILLDLSNSMNATDIKPSRLIRAKQKIEDLISLSKGVKIGLIAFAADSHMITPLTDDVETIRHLLPTLETDLVHVQGSKLSPGLEMATAMLTSEPGYNKAILIISDGGFEDASAMMTANKISKQGVLIHTLGVGTKEGAPIKDFQGNLIKKNGTPIYSKLKNEQFKEISKIGGGRYLDLLNSDQDIEIVLNELEARGEAQLHSGITNRLWEEHFYLFLIPVLPLFLWWFRKGYVLALVFILPFTSFHHFVEANDYFINAEQRGKRYLDEGDYGNACHQFSDPYKKGVCCYKAGNYAEAEKLFRESFRPEVDSNALYNLGNSLAQQQKFQEAIQAYEKVLQQQPDHTKSQKNLELIKKLMEEQKQEDAESQNSDQQKNQDKESRSGKEEPKDQQKKNQESQQEKSVKENQTKENPKDQNQESRDADKKETDIKNQSESRTAAGNEQGQNERDSPERTEIKEEKSIKSQEEYDADLLLNRIEQDPKMFMKNKFYIESKKMGTKEGVDPW